LRDGEVQSLNYTGLTNKMGGGGGSGHGWRVLGGGAPSPRSPYCNTWMTAWGPCQGPLSGLSHVRSCGLPVVVGGHSRAPHVRGCGE
jgi:hypothetical protein